MMPNLLKSNQMLVTVTYHSCGLRFEIKVMFSVWYRYHENSIELEFIKTDVNSLNDWIATEDLPLSVVAKNESVSNFSVLLYRRGFLSSKTSNEVVVMLSHLTTTGLLWFNSMRNRAHVTAIKYIYFKISLKWKKISSLHNDMLKHVDANYCDMCLCHNIHYLLLLVMSFVTGSRLKILSTP